MEDYEEILAKIEKEASKPTDFTKPEKKMDTKKGDKLWLDIEGQTDTETELDEEPEEDLDTQQGPTEQGVDSVQDIPEGEEDKYGI